MVFETVKRLLVGRPVHSERLGHTLLPKKIALPVFASDALSSVAYATRRSCSCCPSAGIAFIAYTPWIALAVGAADAGRGGLLPAERARLPVGRRRLRGHHHQLRRPRRHDGGQRADGRLHADGGGVGLLWRGQPGLRVPGPELARHADRGGGGCRHRDHEPARRARVGHRRSRSRLTASSAWSC